MHKICVDCAMGIVNADFTSMAEDTESQVRKGMASLAADGISVFVDTENMIEFTMHSRCFCCDSTLGGSRFPITVEGF